MRGGHTSRQQPGLADVTAGPKVAQDVNRVSPLSDRDNPRLRSAGRLVVAGGADDGSLCAHHLTPNANLTGIENSILDAIGTFGALRVTELRGKTAYAHFDGATQSAVHTHILKKMEARGLVRRLDDQRPIAWRRVAAPEAPYVRANLETTV